VHFYKFHINDYAVQTRHLSNDEDLCFRRLLDLYYTEESPIPLETDWIARRIQMGCEVVETVLNDFFTETKSGWINNRADAEIAEYHAVCARAKANGKKGGRPSITQRKPTGNQAGTQRKASRKLSLIINQQSEYTPIVPTGDLDLVLDDESSDQPDPGYSSDFLTFWEAFPEKKGKGAAWKAWGRIKARPSLDILLEAILLQKADRSQAMWRGEFYPEWKNPSTWLHGACWDDGLKFAQKKEKCAAADYPANWRDLLVDQFPENYPDGLQSGNFPNAFHLLPASVQAELRAAAVEHSAQEAA
jgi:uncharacterized protein YdaU (DUF1376 family)